MFGYRCVLRAALLALALPGAADASQWFVAVGAAGNGSTTAPFGTIQAAVAAAQPGDTIIVRPGTYPERIITRRNGTAGAPITLRAEAGRGSVLVTVPAEVVQIDHAYHVIDGFIFDAQFSFNDALDINSPATGFTLRNSEVRRAKKDCVDVGATTNVLIENSLIHHCLNADGGRTDAHGVVAGAVRDFTLRNTEIHTFSGDAFQVDPGRNPPGWDRVTIEGCTFWLAPLAQPTNGFAAGTVTGENAIDTKTLPTAPRGLLVVRDTVAYGFRNGLITNMAAFNLKEHVDALVDGVTVYDSEIAFRTRGPGANGGAWVRVQNAVVYNVYRAFRYEDDIERLTVLNTTIGSGVTQPFQAASSGRAGLDVQNVLIVAGSKPIEAADASNLAVDASHFVNAAAGDYRLQAHSPAVDTGVTIASVNTDRRGTPRPQGPAYDVGAFEAPAGSAGDLPVVAIGNVTVNEGNSGASQAKIELTLSMPSEEAVSVQYSTVAGTATAGVDYAASSDAVTFAPGITQQTVSVPIVGDLLDEDDETLSVVLSQPQGATIAAGSGLITITDNDTARLRVGDVVVTEPTASSQAMFVVRLSTPSSRAVQAAWLTTGGTATPNVDYASAQGVVSFAPGQMEVQVPVTIFGDALDEADETFNLVLSDSVGAGIADNSGRARISDVDPSPNVSIVSAVNVVEGTSNKKITIQLSLSAASGQTVKVGYATADGTALASHDYVAASGTVSFAPGVTTRTITLTVLADTLTESSEQFRVLLSNPINVTIATGQSTVTLADRP